MKSLSKEFDVVFGRRFWKGFLMCIAFAFSIAVSLTLMAVIAYYGNKYNW